MTNVSKIIGKLPAEVDVSLVLAILLARRRSSVTKYANISDDALKFCSFFADLTMSL